MIDHAKLPPTPDYVPCPNGYWSQACSESAEEAAQEDNDP